MARRLCFALLALLLTGCSNLDYYSQAIGGHLQLMLAARPIGEVIADPQSDAGLRESLGEVRRIRDFASRELGLPDNGSYRSYADIKRPFVVWNVFAAPEFSLHAEKWCMLVVGCVAYRGFYDKQGAELLAEDMRRQGFDTFVGGVQAYSTLGYFDDPVLNTFLKSGSVDVARVIFHELAHQLIYVDGDTDFNESFATAVENEGLRRWLLRSPNPELAQKVADRDRRRAAFVALVAEYRDKLDKLYLSPLPEAEKRLAKAEVLVEMKRAYTDLQDLGGDAAAYLPWFERDLNNAKIASVTLYTRLVPAFEALLHAEGDDLPRFYRRVRALAALPKDDRQTALQRLQPMAELPQHAETSVNTATQGSQRNAN
jgi:predicted aminopeptidase